MSVSSSICLLSFFLDDLSIVDSGVSKSPTFGHKCQCVVLAVVVFLLQRGCPSAWGIDVKN